VNPNEGGIVQEWTYAKVGRGCFAVYGPDGREVTRYGFESDARFRVRQENTTAEQRDVEGTRALIAGLEREGLL